MRIEKWYDGNYYRAETFVTEEENTEKLYLGTSGARVEVITPTASFLERLHNQRRKQSGLEPQFVSENTELDALDEEIVARIAASAMLTKKQLIRYLKLCRVLEPVSDASLESWMIGRRLNRLFELQLLEKVIVRYPKSKLNHEVFRMTRKGQKIASKKGVRIHSGNMYQSERDRRKTGLLDTTEEILRVIAANEAALQILDKKKDVEYIEFMASLYISNRNRQLMGGITRSAFSTIQDDGSVVLYEVFRRPDYHKGDAQEYEKYVKDKVRRYFSLVQHEDFLKNNSMGFTEIPKLAIIAESSLHREELEWMINPIVSVLQVDERAKVIVLEDNKIA